jgi:Leucine-rich repeat (LRR) protein
MSKRPLCIDEPHFLAFKKSRVARFLLVPAPRPTNGVSITSQLNEAELAILQEYGALLPWLTSANAKRKQITDAFVEVLSAAAPNLRALSLSGNAAITDSSLMLLGFRCRRLKTLELQGCDGVTAQGLEFVIANCRNELEVLDVRACPLVDDVVANAIALCPNIRELYLSGTAITSAGVRAIVNSCNNLEIIDLSSIALESSDVQQIMASLGHHLHAVDISFCMGLLPADVQHIFDTNPSINVKAFGLDLFGVRVPAEGTLVY